MATVIRTKKRTREFGPRSSGMLMSPAEFDRASFVEGWRYELIHGVLVVSPSPLENERDPNEELGRLLRNYQEDHPQGGALDATLNEQTVRSPLNRRRADRAIWAGLGRLPRINETPTILVEFVSEGKRSRKRDYEEKRDEYLAIGVKEYWVIDRFEETMTVFTWREGESRRRVLRKSQTYSTKLLPGFVVPLARLIELANRWPEEDPEQAQFP